MKPSTGCGSSSIGRIFGIPLPLERFKPRKVLSDRSFEDIAISRSRRILRPDQIVRMKGW